MCPMTKNSTMKNITQMLEQIASMIPNAEERARMTNEKIVGSLKKIGIATREEVEALEERVEALERELEELRSAKAAGSERAARASKTRAKDESPEATT
jgi:polyhydroxyalkanoate synthesis regulator phasin